MKVWNPGDTLYAADLNAAFSNPQITAAEFLNAGNSRSLAYIPADTALEWRVNGSTVPHFKIGDDRVIHAGFYDSTGFSSQNLSNTPLKAFMVLNGTLAGTMSTAVGNHALFTLQTVSDTLAAGGGGVTGINLNLTSGGTGTTGNRVGQVITMLNHGSPTAKSLGYGYQVGGYWSYLTIDGGFGGTAGSGNDFGVAWGGLSSVQLSAGAMYLRGIVAHEFNWGVDAGASSTTAYGILLALGRHKQAVSPLDAYIGTGMVYPDNVQLGTIYGLGAAVGYWGLDASGDIMRLIPTNASLGPLPYTARNGINLQGIDFYGFPFISEGFSVDPAGSAIVKNLVHTGATADQSDDVYVATAAGSRTIPDGCSWQVLTPAAAIASFTTIMPAAPIDGQDVLISTTKTITAWTLSANSGQTINGAPTTLAADASVMFRYNQATSTWLHIF